MALWKETAKTDSPEPIGPIPTAAPEQRIVAEKPPQPAVRPAPSKPVGESLIAPDITIEGKIEGAGHVRIAGNFKGDVNVRGDVTIETGAKVNGSVRADKVTVAGELTGNIESAKHVELLQTGALSGDLKAGSLAVAAGSRMRGQVEFGWDSKDGSQGLHTAGGSNGAGS